MLSSLWLLSEKQTAATKNTSCCFPSPSLFSWSAKQDLGRREGGEDVFELGAVPVLPRSIPGSTRLHGSIPAPCSQIYEISDCNQYKGVASQRSSLKKVTVRSWWSQNIFLMPNKARLDWPKHSQNPAELGRCFQSKVELLRFFFLI